MQNQLQQNMAAIQYVGQMYMKLKHYNSRNRTINIYLKIINTFQT